jgi:hypothetical protein
MSLSKLISHERPNESLLIGDSNRVSKMKPDTTHRISSESDTSRRPPINPSRITTFGGCIDNAFDDKRVTIACISVWFFICLGGFTWLGIFGSAYMRVGPSPTLTYMGMKIDTMARYLTVVGFVVISTAINDFASDAISPWIQNTVMDHKSRTIPYSKFTMLFITQTWSLYCGTMSVASIALVFAQFDLIMIRLVVDLFVNQYTIRRFLSNKSHDPYRYHTEFLNEDETDALHDNSEGSFIGRHSASGVMPRSIVEPPGPSGVFNPPMSNSHDPSENVVTPPKSNMLVQPAYEPTQTSKKSKRGSALESA